MLYFAVAMLGVFSCIMGWIVPFYIFKMSIIPIIVVCIILTFRKIEHPLIPILLTAIFFSFLGDFFFLIKIEEDLFKILGITTFTVAQISYSILYYLSTRNKTPKKHPGFGWLELFIVLTLIGSLYVLTPTLGVFQIPVVIYAITTCVAFYLAARRRFFVPFKSFVLVLLGVFAFLTSDLLTGPDIYLNNSLMHAAVFAFTSIGHYLTVSGMMKQFLSESRVEAEKDPNIFSST